MVDAAFWRNKKVFLTGHTGFKGAWLSIWLQQLGANVTGFSRPAPTSPSLFETASVKAGMNSIVGDIRDAEQLAAAVRETKPEIVIHMAAQSLVRYGFQNPVETYATNVMGLVNLLEAIRMTPSVRAVVNVTSDKCYENREWVWGYRENEPMGGFDPYSSSKGCAELVTSAYRRSYFSGATRNGGEIALASGRAGNVIGGGDWAADRLIPDMVRAIEAGRPVKIRNPKATRPWQHVLEPINGYLMLAEHLYTHGQRYADGWNFGPERSDIKPVDWIATELAALWGDGASWVQDPISGPHEAHSLSLDCSKATNELGWRPIWGLHESLKRIVEWHKSYNAQGNMGDLTRSQINDFENDQTKKGTVK